MTQTETADRQGFHNRGATGRVAARPAPAYLTTFILGLLILSLGSAARAEYKGEFIPFPMITVHYNDRDIAGTEQHGSEAAVDFFYTGEYDKARLLAEFYINSEERELERLALGWAISDDTRLWLGRYHTDLDQWNRKHHHGAYLQTTIYRPGIIQFEDAGGVIPAHATGISLQSNRDSADHTDNITFDIGLGPELEPGNLEAFNLLKPHDGNHGLFISATVSRQPLTRPFDDSGLFFAFSIIPSSTSDIDEVKLNILGGYTNYSAGAWMLRGSLIRISSSVEPQNGATIDEDFYYAYLQPEYTLHPKWLLYGRSEVTQGAGANTYLEQIPAYVRHRVLIGARHHLARSQALKFELATLDQFGQRHVQAIMQWSAAFP